jgi:hypothetical protein
LRNADFHTGDVKKCCENKLGIHFKKGGELNGWYKLSDKKIARITIPKGKKPIPPKTYKSMAAQLKLNVDQFDSLLDCILTGNDYKHIIRDAL